MNEEEEAVARTAGAASDRTRGRSKPELRIMIDNLPTAVYLHASMKSFLLIGFVHSPADRLIVMVVTCQN